MAKNNEEKEVMMKNVETRLKKGKTGNNLGKMDPVTCQDLGICSKFKRIIIRGKQ